MSSEVAPAAERLHTQKLQYERAVIGACLLDEAAWVKASAAVTPADFANVHKAYWGIMIERSAAGTAPMLADIIPQAAALGGDTDHINYLMQLTDAVSRTSHIQANVSALQAVNEKLRLLALFDRLAGSLATDTPEEIASKLEIHVANLRASSNGHKLELISAADMAKIIGDIEWLWEDWLPKGFATVISGPTGKGKSFIAQAIVSAFVEGKPWPDGQKNSGKHKVVWYETEGKQALFTMRGKEMGFNLEDVYFVGTKGDEHINLAKPQEVARLQKACEESEAELLIVDALYLAHDRDENAADIRHVIHYLSELARTSNMAVLVVHHNRKHAMDAKTEAASLDDMRGSSTIANACAIVWLLDKPDPENDMLRLRVEKSNFSELCDPLGFWIDDNGPHFETDLNMVPRCPKRKMTAIENACEIIKGRLRHKPQPYQDLLVACEAAGIGEGTVQRARKKLRLVSTRTGFGNGAQTIWSLPSRQDESDDDDFDPLAEG